MAARRDDVVSKELIAGVSRVQNPHESLEHKALIAAGANAENNGASDRPTVLNAHEVLASSCCQTTSSFSQRTPQIFPYS